MKVLVIEGNLRVIRDVQFCLKVRWPDVVMVSIGEGQKGIEMVETETPDLVIVGSTLPDMDTAELITVIREFSDVLLIVLAEGQSDMEKVRCLESGADDYINTPFSPMELLAKVRVLLRRTWGLGFNSREERPLLVGDKLSINAGTREVLLADRPVRLTPIEYRILLELARNRGRIVSHELLLQRVWGTEYASDVGFVKRYVYRLRQKLEADNGKQLIISERGIGYRLGQYD
jgi:two-component system, OmpR family, KDP operon response regulator KdpE